MKSYMKISFQVKSWRQLQTIQRCQKIHISNTVSVITCRDTSSNDTRTCRSTVYAQSRTESTHSTSINHTTIHRTTVIDVAAINDTTDRLTIANGCTSRANVSVSSNEASFGTNSQESKRMSLGENPSFERGVLAAEDLRWLPRQRSREVQCTPTCWNPDTTEKRGPVLIPCVQDEVVEAAFALSHHKAIKIAETPAIAMAALARQGRGEGRVSTLTPREREELIKAKQKEISSFLKHAAVEAAASSGLQCKSLMRMR